MTGSQSSMDSYLGRFENAITLLQNDPDYLPTRADIQKAALLTFVTQLRQSSNTVSLLASNLTTLRAKRHDMAFKQASNTPESSIEAIISNVLNYIGAENGQNHSVYKSIKSYLKKMRPKAKTTNEDGSKSPSRSEKTFTALEGYFEHVVHLVSNSAGLIYNPSNTAIQITKLTALAADFSQLNRDIATAERDETTARADRRALFNSDKGAKNLAKDIKMYLSSYSGGKLNPKYIQFATALA